MNPPQTAASIAGSVLLPFLYVAILVFDGIYFAATVVYARRERSAKRHNLW